MDGKKEIVMMSSEGAKAFIKLTNLAIEMTFCSLGERVDRWRKKGYPEPIPEEFTPGYLLKYLSPEERAAIGTLTSEQMRWLSVRPECVPEWG